MRDDILEIFKVNTDDIYPDNDTWILDPELYPEDIFGELPERAQQKMKAPTKSVRLTIVGASIVEPV